MDKLLLFPGSDSRGVYNFVIDTEKDHLVKTAAEYHPKIAEYIRNAKKISGKTQVLLTALGAGEWWGPNRNSDFFPEAALAHEGDEFGYKTFEKYAKVYKHHINKFPTASYGDIALSVYNPSYHRVELIILLDNNRAPDIAERIDSGEFIDWSMGVKVPFDICSICGNKAPNRKQYCDHLKYYLGRIEPETGKVAYAINTRPRFFDISQVLIGADKTAKTLMKVASAYNTTISSALLAEKMAANKEATIEKKVPVADPPASVTNQKELLEGVMEVKAREPNLPEPVLNRLGEAGLAPALTTLSMLGILPKPQEFQRIVMISVGRKDIADKLDSHNLCFDPLMAEDPSDAHMRQVDLGARHFSPLLMEQLRPHIADRSYAAPVLGRRLVIMLEKNASEQPLPRFIKVAENDERKPFGIIPVLATVAGLYAALARKAAPAAAGQLDKLLLNHPGVAAALGIGAVMVGNQLFGAKNRGQTTLPEGNPDVSTKPGEAQRSPFFKVGSVAKAVFLGTPAVYMASGIAQKHHEASPQDQNRRIFHMIRKYPDLISAAMVAGTIAASRYGLSEKLKNLKKFASGDDWVSNALIWPVAFGGSSLAGRIAGGVFDQAVFEASRKLLSKQKNPTKLKSNT